MDTATPTNRLHALDNLRALMMWLGIVLHVCIMHVAGDSKLPWLDTQRTLLADALQGFIHAFRMPVFFILAGFFAALLLQGRGAGGMARHRLRRLALPFVLFWPLLYVLSDLAVMAFLHRAAYGTWGLDRSLEPGGGGGAEGPSTMHLWFLWMLLWFSLAAAAVAAIPSQALRRALAWAGAALRSIGGAWWGFLALTLPLLAAAWDSPHGFVAASGSFLPGPAEWLQHGMFFAFGLALYHRRDALFVLYQRRWASYAVAGLAFFVAAALVLHNWGPPRWLAFTYNAAGWLWSFALIGLALRLMGRRNAVLAYLAESAYWVYLVHFPLTIVCGAAMAGLAWPAEAKMAINIVATTAVCLASYQLAVRSTWVGALLNGRRHRQTRVTPASVARYEG